MGFVAASNLPTPPIHLTVNTGGQWADTSGVIVALLTIAIAAYRLHRRYGTWIPVIIAIGGLVAGFMEPVYDVGGNLWYMKHGQVSLLSTFGMNMPVWVLFSYGAAYGGLGLTIWWMVERRATRRQLWSAVVGLWVFFVLLEICNLALGTYTYYGPQPFRVHNFPIWVSLANAAVCVAFGVVVALAGRVLAGRREWWLLFAGPVIVGAGLFGTTFPATVALHVVDPSRLLMYGAALAANLLAFGMAGLSIAVLPAAGLTPRPLVADSARRQPDALGPTQTTDHLVRN